MIQTKSPLVYLYNAQIHRHVMTMCSANLATFPEFNEITKFNVYSCSSVNLILASMWQKKIDSNFFSCVIGCLMSVQMEINTIFNVE